MGDRKNDKLQLQDFESVDLKTLVRAHSVDTGLLTEASSFSEQVSTEDTELSSTDISINANKTTGTSIPAEFFGESNPKHAVTRTVSILSPSCAGTDQPKSLCALLTSSTETCTVYDVSQSFTSVSRSQDSLKVTPAHTEADREDLCAAVLMACLFCQPLDCLVATMRGCNECVWSLCSFVCGCESATIQPLMEMTHHCDLCSCLGAPCFMCDCPICDICLQATECLDLAMEVSQMLYH
ncbi:uncharacterized protein si:dkey-245f22.3 [Betta splendens]|uniref:Uncharacterized protein si:dkey-245f22.3 n=1 Tax=Betta splendens TaxID=158456 RepID=A0A6P7MJF7_BETSP|nr:uncharacterized protein si:dkey-245f22.3 [Betta splendens]